MKRSDVWSLILVAGIGVVAAFLACNAILGNPGEAKVEYKTVKKVLTSEVVEPSEEIFNARAIEPTIEVYVGACEDLDKNGILDEAEMAICRGGTENDEDEE